MTQSDLQNPLKSLRRSPVKPCLSAGSDPDVCLVSPQHGVRTPLDFLPVDFQNMKPPSRFCSYMITLYVFYVFSWAAGLLVHQPLQMDDAAAHTCGSVNVNDGSRDQGLSEVSWMFTVWRTKCSFMFKYLVYKINPFLIHMLFLSCLKRCFMRC